MPVRYQNLSLFLGRLDAPKSIDLGGVVRRNLLPITPQRRVELPLVLSPTLASPIHIRRCCHSLMDYKSPRQRPLESYLVDIDAPRVSPICSQYCSLALIWLQIVLLDGSL